MYMHLKPLLGSVDSGDNKLLGLLSGVYVCVCVCVCVNNRGLHRQSELFTQELDNIATQLNVRFFFNVAIAVRKSELRSFVLHSH